MSDKRIMKTLLIVSLSIVCGIVATGCGEPKTIERTGQVEMREIDIASKIPGRVEWIRVDEGEEVREGQELFKLTDREVRAKVAQAQGAVDAAKAQWSMSVHGAREEQIEMAERQLAAAKSQYDLAEKTRNRMRALHNEKLISDQELDGIEQKYQAALAAMEAARAQRDMARKGSRIEEKQMARGQYDRAQQSYEEAASYLDETIAHSPIAGIVGKRYFDQDELVATGYPVLTVFNPADAWIELNLPAPEMEHLRIGQVIEGRIHGLGITAKFTVSAISAMADFANWRAQNDRGTFDVRSFTIKLKPAEPIAGLRPGMTVALSIPR